MDPFQTQFHNFQKKNILDLVYDLVLVLDLVQDLVQNRVQDQDLIQDQEPVQIFLDQNHGI